MRADNRPFVEVRNFGGSPIRLSLKPRLRTAGFHCDQPCRHVLLNECLEALIFAGTGAIGATARIASNSLGGHRAGGLMGPFKSYCSKALNEWPTGSSEHPPFE